jgi:arginyl-tRNA synthetase
MHVSKSIWGLLKNMEEDAQALKELSSLKLEERIAYFGKSYSRGATAYEEDEAAKKDMKELNFLIFKAAQEVVLPKHHKKPEVNYDQFIKKGKYEYEQIKELYKIGREWSLEYFERIYKRLGTKFDGYYPESLTGEYGYGMVVDGLKKRVFVKGEGGAIIFPGSKYGLHERVFINALGLPTYETKDFGNAIAKQVDFPYDQSIIVTGNEINDYFQVVIKALSLLHPEVGEKTKHIGHGMVRLPEGKMSSRTGKILKGEWLLDEAKHYALKLSDSEEIAEMVGTGAIKYALLKNSIGKDVEFSFEESISFDGNSGPYLQYTFARTESVLRKSQISNLKSQISMESLKVTQQERDILRLLNQFPEIILEAAQRYSPHILCTYLFDLAQAFNFFYQKLPILKAEERERDFRLQLTQSTGIVLKQGLYLLGIQAPEKM